MAGLLGGFFGGSGDILIKVGADVSDAVKGLGEVKGAVADTGSTGAKLKSGIESAAVPAAAALTGLAAAGIACAKAAASAQASQAALNDQIRRSTGASDDQIKAADDWVSAFSGTVTFTKGELNPALAGLVRATGSVKKAQDLLKLSADTAAASHKDLGSVAAAVGKAYNGSAGSLKRLVPTVDAAAASAGKWGQVQKELNQQVGGAAADEAKTTAGQYEMLGKTMQGIQVAIGTALLPAFSALLDIMLPLSKVAKDHAQIFVILGGAVGAVAAAILALNAAFKIYTAVTKAWTVVTKIAQAVEKVWVAVQWAMNTALAANPILLVVVAVVALAAALVLAYKHSATFRGIVQGAFRAVADAAETCWNAIKSVVEWIAHLPGVSGQIKALTSLWNTLKGAVEEVISAIGRLISAIGRIHFPSLPHLPGLSGVSYGVPAPMYAAPYAMETGQGMIVNVTVTGAVDPESTALQIRRILQRYDRRRGRSPLGGEAPDQ